MSRHGRQRPRRAARGRFGGRQPARETAPQERVPARLVPGAFRLSIGRGVGGVTMALLMYTLRKCCSQPGVGHNALVLGVAQADITGRDAEGAPIIRLQAKRPVRVEP